MRSRQRSLRLITSPFNHLIAPFLLFFVWLVRPPRSARCFTHQFSIDGCALLVMAAEQHAAKPIKHSNYSIKKKVNSKRLLVFSLLMKKMEQAWRTKTIEEIGEVKFMCARGPGAITHNSLSSIKRQQSTIPAHFILLHYWFALFVSERWVCGREASLPKKMKQLSRIVFTH